MQDPCSNFCQNGGKCFINSGLIVGCDCPCQYEGQRCEKPVDFCNSNVCQNGDCVANPSKCNYDCSCDPGYIGKYCEITINACYDIYNSSKPMCQNGASCTNLFYTYSCECTPGFTGRNCETKIDPCQNNLCKFGSQCLPLKPLNNDYYCSCKCPYYSGEYCEVNFNCRIFIFSLIIFFIF